ncbi:MAG TPA: Rne/Rng family ribonuclease [Paracoccus sp. (in: a-proteobacteria)]|uniref:Rne/Rng family ribonuclease n=1 Tax=uncultured Paracoccus sp. TaxID=189685 RepID=UPI00262BA895|nr:Rne/Rng family ribonuclease [uncultured Paracoccus sp.]HMQ42363.1 Rne/Rng family ribonuclease [Paracoccus sp. (in: a-proteobacteria)]HMR36741.1 Rne/Rng family ribonuclease [Paracoccus sp. (in: a-proteobacteria)]
MAKKMLIDATHAEETRVVVVDGTKVEEFDFETVNKRQLAGNIYLAKVTRVEPSLQAAFVDYGGNRHGFLAFAEIHPDYYQIPAADRQALIEEERAYAEAVAAEEAANDKPKSSRRRKPRGAKAEKAETGDAKLVSEEIPGMELVDNDGEGDEAEAAAGADDSVATPAVEEAAEDSKAEDSGEADDKGDESSDENDGDEEAKDASDRDDSIESVAEEDVTEEIRVPKKPRARRYKIQEVIKVRQIMLVQVVKEERGNKGAALTTYLSLAGRYCVLMPNTARGGGISRKITNIADRKKLKDIAGELKVPQGAGLIIRTAGSQRTRTEIKRDYEYLMRLWEQIRDLTFKSIAPAPIYEEGDLIKRTIRDLYSREIDEVLVEGERGYRTAKDFMKMIMPSHARNVKHYTDPMPLFARFQVEGYLAGMFNPTVQLKSGGYIVIGVTEALVAIDVNSGRATKEGSIEDTATKTNLEAADEIARQLRLRDLAGLIVIDFIDMDERKNNSAVEKRLKDRLKTDRARIQVGKISGFGLMEMSRQRLRPGMLESTTQPCAHCHGTGLIRSDDSLALTILRAIEEEGTRKRSREVLVKAPVAVANFLMNGKREHIAMIEARYGMSVRVEADPALISPDFAIEKFKTATRNVPEVASPVVSVDAQLMAQIDDDELPEIEEDEEDEREDSVSTRAEGDEGEGSGRSKRRRRRRRRGGKDRAEGADGAEENGAEAAEADAVAEDAAEGGEAVSGETEAEAEEKPKSRSRSRSRSRRKPEPKAEVEAGEEVASAEAEPAAEASAEIVDLRDLPAAPAEPVVQEAPAQEPDPVEAADNAAAAEEEVQVIAAEASAETVASAEAPSAEPVAVSEAAPEPEAGPARPKRRGWWSIG